MLSKKIDGLSDEFAEIKREIKDDTLDIDGFVKMTEELEKYKENLQQLDERAKSKKQNRKCIQEKQCVKEMIYC